jgi:Flp pilus assembly protein TadG
MTFILRGGIRRRHWPRLCRAAVGCAAARRIRNEESGVVVVLVAGMMVMVLGMGALAIDLGSFYKAQRQAQAAADAGALAASQDLPNSTGTATTDGRKYAIANYPSANATVVTPYNGSPSQVKVTVNARSPAILGGLFGVTSANISATAVAAGGGGPSVPTAVFAMSTTCTDAGATINGASIVVAGGTHSNGSVTVSGASNDSGPTTYGGPHGCGYTANGSSNASGGVAPIVDANVEPWPIDYSKLTYPAPDCTPGPNTFIAPSFTWTSGTTGNIPPGVYCATTGDITLSGSSLNATGCTFIAQQGNIDVGGASLTTSGNFFANGANGSITIHGSNISLNGVLEATGANGQINITGAGINGNVTMIGTTLGLSGAGITLAPYPGYQNLTAYQTGTQLLKFSGAGYVSGGSIFAPNAAIDFSGAGNALGMLEAQDVSLHGAGYTFTGNGPTLAGTAIIATLVQ